MRKSVKTAESLMILTYKKQRIILHDILSEVSVWQSCLLPVGGYERSCSNTIGIILPH
ncbi:MAG: hypothetical protein JSW33_16305 [bacterium]|nr:MAG: hypothetical protein JSW33_16305 [bacterium]